MTKHLSADLRFLPFWARCELAIVGTGSAAMNVWSPWGEPWWWRIMFLAVAADSAAGLLLDFRDRRDVSRQAELDELGRAYAQACMNLATLRPSGIEGATIGDDADRYHDALLAGWGGIGGWDDRG